jgi:hypothetical protein
LVKKELEKKITTNNQIEHGEIEMSLETRNENNSASSSLEIYFNRKYYESI